MPAQLIAIIITGVISGLDLIVNVAAVLTSGETSCSCGRARYKHRDKETAAGHNIRRASVGARSEKEEDSIDTISEIK